MQALVDPNKKCIYITLYRKYQIKIRERSVPLVNNKILIAKKEIRGLR